jgi:hypothetical protein
MKAVLSAALFFSVTMTVGFALMDYFYDGRIQFSSFQDRGIVFFTGGLAIGLICRWQGGLKKGP